MTIEEQIADHPGAELTDSRKHYGQAQGQETQKQEPLPLLLIDNKHCRAVIAMQGAQILEFTPKGAAPLLWLSPNAIFSPGAAIRGGIPVCLPWFGVNQQDPEKPKHGFARTRDWELVALAQTDTDTTTLLLAFDYQAEQPHLFSYPFRAALKITLGKQLTLDLTIANCGSKNMPLSWALHSYHPRSDLAETQVEGLQNRNYLDNTDALKTKRQADPGISFTGEVDRVYESVGGTQSITGKPQITISGTCSETVIVWNPGAANAAHMSDIGAGGEQEFICVERGAAFGDSWRLAPGESRTGQLTIASTSPGT